MANYQTQISWAPEGPYAPWDRSQIQIYGSPPYGTPLLTNSTVELSIVVPLAIGQHLRRITIYDVDDPNWLNYTAITVTTLPQAPGVDFGFEIDHRDIYFDVSKNTLTLDAMGRIYCMSFHIFSINVTHNAPGLDAGGGYWMDGHNTCGPTSPADPNCLLGIQFTIDPSKVLNGTYPVEFTAYTNSTNSISVMVRVHIRVMITKAWISPQSPLWGEEVTVYANITRGMHIAWARLFYSIDKGISWRMEYMRPYWPEADLYAGYIPSQMVGMEVLYYVEASDRSGNVEKYPHSIVYDTQTYTVGMPVWAVAFAFLMVITVTAVIVTIRRKHLPQLHYHHLQIMDKRINRRMRPIYWGSALTFVGIFLTFLISKVLSGYGRYIVTGPPFSPSKVDVPPFYMPLAYVGMFALYLIYFSLPIAIAIESYLYFKGRKGEGKRNEEIA